MLRVVKRQFDIDHNITVMPGDIVDVTGMKHARSLEDNGFIGVTNATVATVSQAPPKDTSTASASAKANKLGRSKKVKRSALASRPRVFKRKA